jgi:hypothetical protein
MKTDSISLQRICIYPKDLQIITGKSERYARKLLKQIKQHFGKEEYQVLTVNEMCNYLGLDQQEVTGMLKL